MTIEQLQQLAATNPNTLLNALQWAKQVVDDDEQGKDIKRQLHTLWSWLNHCGVV